MKGTITVKDKTIDLVSNALTPILYRQIFHKDFLREISEFKKLKGKKREDYTEEDLEIITSRYETFSRLAFVMAKQAEIKETARLVNLGINNYYEWLMQFETNDMNDPHVMGDLLAIWSGNAGDSHVEGKNADSQE